MSAYTEGVRFRLVRMPCCEQLLCWVNPRLPNFCPECGRRVLGELRARRERFLIEDGAATLRYVGP